MKVRRDAWSHEDDLLLAQTTLRHIREGSTQVAAFDEVGDQLNRTSAACGYRWNAEVRPRYLDAIASAKRQRKTDQTQHKSSEAQEIDTKKLTPEIKQDEPVCSTSQLALTLEDCITFLSTYNTKGSTELRSENDELIRENNQLKKENEELTVKYHQLIANREKLIDDYSLFMNVINQASTMEEKKGRNMLIN